NVLRQRSTGLMVVGVFGFDAFAVAGIVFDARLGLPDHGGASLVVIRGPEGELAVLRGLLRGVVAVGVAGAAVGDEHLAHDGGEVHRLLIVLGLVADLAGGDGDVVEHEGDVDGVHG